MRLVAEKVTFLSSARNNENEVEDKKEKKSKNKDIEK